MSNPVPTLNLPKSDKTLYRSVATKVRHARQTQVYDVDDTELVAALDRMVQQKKAQVVRMTSKAVVYVLNSGEWVRPYRYYKLGGER